MCEMSEGVRLERDSSFRCFWMEQSAWCLGRFDWVLCEIVISLFFMICSLTGNYHLK